MTTSTSDGAGFQETRLDINGIDTLVLSAGAGDPVVFFHGAGTASGFDWLLPIARQLPAAQRIPAPQLPLSSQVSITPLLPQRRWPGEQLAPHSFVRRPLSSRAS